MCFRYPGISLIFISCVSVIQSDVIRLRRLFSTLPSGRHYIPSVLFIQWTGSTTLTTPILSEINTLLEKKIILDVRVLAFNNDDLNDQFRNILKEISFDTVGRLVKKMGLEGNAQASRFFAKLGLYVVHRHF